MVLAHAVHLAATFVHDAVRIAHVRLGRQGRRLASELLAIQALVGEVGEVEHAVADSERAPAVLVDGRAHVKG